MTTLAFWIYIGGCFARWDRKIGFWRRACWPVDLGERIAESVYDTDPRT